MLQSVVVPGAGAFPVAQIREDFPALRPSNPATPFVYLDSAASGQKPQAVLDFLFKFYSRDYGHPNNNYTAGELATQAEATSRQKVADFIGAKSASEIVFVRGTTEAINLVAAGFAQSVLGPNDEIIITQMEHHANIVPWQLACRQTKAKLVVAPITPAGGLDLSALENCFSKKTKIISLPHASQVLGTINPIKQITQLAHAYQIPVMVDGAQTVPHMPVQVQDLDCDFFAFSGHKMGGPTGVGVLYGKTAWLEKLPPYQGGSEMASHVSFDDFTLAELPKRLEAGTIPFAQIFAFSALLDYLNKWGMANIAAYEQDLLRYALDRLGRLKPLRVLGSAPQKEPLISFTLGQLDVKKVERYLNTEKNISLRAGLLGSEPLLRQLGLPGALRASFAYYNTHQEIDYLAEALETYLRRSG